ncbi:hypothetical protein [Myxococcus sp. Y35]|uniref:hypothetical protein n=1 Tax=Pseudomyxococcus flavus TaxID=3115648 RepID=UPI003CEBDDAF
MNAPRLRDVPSPSAPRPHAVRAPAPRRYWDWLKKGLGALLAVWGAGTAFFGAMGMMVGVAETVSPDEGRSTADGLGMLLVFAVFVAVGRFAWKKGLAPFRNARRREQLLGFIRAHPRIRVSDVAAQLRLPEEEVAAMLTTLIARHEVDLVYLSDERVYLHREALERGQNVAQRCPSCDAPVSAVAVLPGDKVTCAYCSAAFLVA